MIGFLIFTFIYLLVGLIFVLHYINKIYISKSDWIICCLIFWPLFLVIRFIEIYEDRDKKDIR